jgi:CRP-like cAMP-binding protein
VCPVRRFSFTVRAVEPTTAVRFEDDGVKAACLEDPSLGYALLSIVVCSQTNELTSARLQLADVYRRGSG